MHWVQALIAPLEVLAEAKQRFPALVVCPLTQSLALAPITSRLAEDVGRTDLPSLDPPEQLAEEIEPGIPSLAAHLSGRAAVVYAATYIHGGTGGQDALVWEAGELKLRLSDNEDTPSKWPDSPISRALRHIGVTRSPKEDEFDAIGLSRYQSNESWARAHGEALYLQTTRSLE